MTKSLLLAGVLSLCGLAIAGSKTYDITLPSAAKAGSVELAAGDYKLKVDGATATITDPHTRQTFRAPIKMSTAPHKFTYTAVETAPAEGSQRITAIDLGGSTMQVEFTTK